MKTEILEKMLKGRIESVVKEIKKKAPFYGHDSGNPEIELDLHKAESKDEKVIEFQKRCDDMFLTSIIMHKPVKELKLFKSFRRWIDEDESELSKAMDGTTGKGAEWIPTDFSRELIEKIEVERRVAKLFERFTMPTSPFKQPIQTGYSTTYKGSSGTAPSDSEAGTGNVTFEAVKLITYVQVDYEFEEDSIIAVLPTIKKIMVKSLARGEESCIISGDTTVPHMDTGISSPDVRTCWKGLRKHAIANGYTTDVSTFDLDALAALYGRMDEYGAIPGDLAWIVGTKIRTKLLTLRDSQNNAVMITMDKIGDKATVLTGMVGELLGSPVIVSQWLPENLNASGIYDGTTTTKGMILLVYRDGFQIGDRRRVLVEQDKTVKTQQIDLVASMREDFEPVHPIATEQLVWAGVNISV